MNKLVEVFYLQEDEFDPHLVGNFIEPLTLELIKLYSLN